jgi:hypothetical protein
MKNPLKPLLLTIACAIVLSTLIRADDATPAPATNPAPAAAPVALTVNRDAFKDFKLSPSTIDEVSTQKVVFGGGNKLQNGAQKPAYGLYLDALTACLTPDAKTSAGQPIADSVVEQIREIIAPGHEPNAGAGLNGWSHHAVAQAFVLAKATPEVWSKLTDDDKNRIDWIMKAMAIAGSFQFDDGNNYNTSLNADDNTNKNWNPNHRLYLFCVLSAAAYFGPDQLNNIYTTFSFDEYMKKFDGLGFSNIKATWGCFNWGPILENGGDYVSAKKQKVMGTGTGVKHPFTYRKIPLSDLAGIYCSVTADLYHDTVTNGIEGKSWILNNGTSPFLGQQGMMSEFNSKDAEGVRSDLDYCDQDFCAYPTMLMTLKAIGQWPANDTTKNLEKLVYVGNEDFLYKNTTGFHSFSHGKGRDTQNVQNVKWSATAWLIDLWSGYLKNNVTHS